MKPKEPVDVKGYIVEHLSQFSTAPFLFVGAGVSRRYLNLENWEGLLRKFSSQCKANYDRMKSTANGDFTQIATLLAREFHDFWWDNPQYDENRELYKSACVNDESALKIEISDYVSKAKTLISNQAISEELLLFSQITVDGIITTNYDTFLEDVFNEFKVYIGQDQLIFATQHGIGEIYKIHGCCTVPNSLVLTSGDYEGYNLRNAYLTAKLLTVFTEHPVIFIGYSLTDKNVQNIIRSIANCLTSQNVDKLRDRLIFVEYDPQNIEGSVYQSDMVLGDFIIPVIKIKSSSFHTIFSALGELKRKFPARLLRQLKEHVYDLVISNENQEKLYVQDIDAEADLSELDVVFGVGAISKMNQKGYTGVTWQEIFDDILDGGDYDPKQVVEQVLPKLLAPSKNIPVFKYLRQAGYLDANGNLINPKVDGRIITASHAQQSNFYPSSQYRKHAASLPTDKAKVQAHLESCSLVDVLKNIALYPEATLDATWILAFLKANKTILHSQNTFEVTQYKKMLCLYDYLANKKEMAINIVAALIPVAVPFKKTSPAKK